MTLNPVVVLIVEDEPVIRMSVVEELQHAGVVVFEAGTADESLTILQANPEISSVFTDVDMPGTMSGTELAREKLAAKFNDYSDFSIPEAPQGRIAARSRLYPETLRY